MTLTSHLCEPAWQALVAETTCLAGVSLQLAKAPPYKLQYLDKRLCRTSLLLDSRHPSPVALPQDEVEPFGPGDDLQPNGFYFVDVPPPTTPEEALRLLPLRGRGWHFVCAVQAALDAGVLDRARIRWAFRPARPWSLLR